MAVIGRDRPGIVAEVSGALLDLGCNLADVATSNLSGYFAMMLVFEAPGGLTLDKVQTTLAQLSSGSHVSATAWEMADAPSASLATHVLTVYGADRKGIVHTVAEVLAGLQVNICDMVCRLHGGAEPVYVLTVEVAIPAPDANAAAVAAALEDAVGALGFQVSLRPLEQAEL